jgi:uncharacterized membrane protein YphA (DoxX/SURF4 family)
MTTSYVLKVSSFILSAFLAFSFGAAGIMKLSPIISPEVHNQLVYMSKQWPSALYLDTVGVSADMLRLAIGAAEASLALLLLTPLATYAAIALASIMIGAILTHVRLDDAYGAGPALFLCFLSVILGIMRGLTKGAAAIESDATKKDADKTN